MADGTESEVERPEAVTLDGLPAVVRASSLRGFDEGVQELGGDADALLAKAQIERATLASRDGLIPLRHYVHLLERASIELDCPSFGLHLGDVRDRLRVHGPLEIVMHNSATIGAAFRYCVEHGQAFTTGTQLSIEEEPEARTAFLRFDVLIGRLPYQRQAVEHTLLILHRHALNLSRGRVRPREIWFTHEPFAAPSVYRSFFGVPVRFGRIRNGLLFAASDFDAAIPDGDPQLLELAASYIEHRYPVSEHVLSTRVRLAIERSLLDGDCTCGGVSATLGIHPRTLQRYLRAEGESFEAIKDSVRRDIALRYLKQSAVPLIRVAEILGYSETSVLSRSCARWFSASPREVRGAHARARPMRGTA